MNHTHADLSTLINPAGLFCQALQHGSLDPTTLPTLG
jgi:hypothetical protein